MPMKPILVAAAFILVGLPAYAAGGGQGGATATPGAGTPSNSGSIENGTTGQGRSSGSSTTMGNGDPGNGTAGTSGPAPSRSGPEAGVPVR